MTRRISQLVLAVVLTTISALSIEDSAIAARSVGWNGWKSVEASFVQKGTNWFGAYNGKRAVFQEKSRTERGIELFEPTHGVTVQLSADQAVIRWEKKVIRLEGGPLGPCVAPAVRWTSKTQEFVKGNGRQWVGRDGAGRTIGTFLQVRLESEEGIVLRDPTSGTLIKLRDGSAFTKKMGVSDWEHAGAGSLE